MTTHDPDRTATARSADGTGISGSDAIADPPRSLGSEPAPAPALGAPAHPWRRFVALGDSFTEGVGDPDPDAPNGVRGWADRVAEQLALGTDDFAYANLAIRGRLIDRIVAEQLDRAIELRPDLVTFSAGGNDLIRPSADADAIAARYERAVERLVATGATVVVLTGVDTRFSSGFKHVRSTVAVYNCHLRAIADRHGCVVADQWGCRSIQDARMWADDRLHLNPLGHHEVARLVLDALGAPHTLAPMAPEPVRPQRWREARRDDLVWARTHVVPWLGRRLRRVSSGDAVSPKYPNPVPLRADAGAGAGAPPATASAGTASVAGTATAETAAAAGSAALPSPSAVPSAPAERSPSTMSSSPAEPTAPEAPSSPTD